MTSQRIADVYPMKKINKKRRRRRRRRRRTQEEEEEEGEEEEKLAKRFISQYPGKTLLEIEAKQLCGNGTAT